MVRPSTQVSVGLAQHRQEESFNKRSHRREFHVGQRVWVRTHWKGEEKFSLGQIMKVIGPVTFIVSVSGRPN